MMEPTAHVVQNSSIVEIGPLKSEKNTVRFTKNPPRYVPVPANARRMRMELIERLNQAEELLLASPFFPSLGAGKLGIVGSGVGYAYAKHVFDQQDLCEEVTLLQIGAYPISAAIWEKFLHQVSAVLVVEELTPFVEEQACLAAFRFGRQIPIWGKNSGHFPLAFEYSIDQVERVIND